MREFMLCLLMLSMFDLKSDQRKPKDEMLIFEGTVLHLGEQPAWVSGVTAVYRLAKYRVERVCGGKYLTSEIVVDHLILSGDELRDIKIGDKVCVTAKRTSEIFVRMNADGIRKPTEVVKTFYIAGDVEPTGIRPCSCGK